MRVLDVSPVVVVVPSRLVSCVCVFVCVAVILTLWLALLLPYKGPVAAAAPISAITNQINSAFANTINGGGGVSVPKLL